MTDREPHAIAKNAAWISLYRIGGVAALLAWYIMVGINLLKLASASVQELPSEGKWPGARAGKV